VYTATAASSIYGNTPSGLTGTTTLSGLVNSDSTTGTAGFTTAATGGTGIGSYAIAGAGLGGTTNYTLTATQAAGNASALTITPKALSILYTATAASSIYGNTPSGLTGTTTVSGLVNSDSTTGTAGFTTAATGATGIGSYAIAGAGLGSSSNYTLTASQASGNVSALTIKLSPLPPQQSLDSLLGLRAGIHSIFGPSTSPPTPPKPSTVAQDYNDSDEAVIIGD
jgi:hypothetical protein